MQRTKPQPDERRLNVRVSEETHYWINLDAARHSRSLQQHVSALMDRRAAEVREQFSGVRPSAEEGRKGALLYPTGGSPAACLRDGDR